MKPPNIPRSIPTVWDPGSRDETQQNPRNTHWVSIKQRDNTHHTKDIARSMIHLTRPSSTRASPNKSQDSGFSDSGDSETSSSIVSSDNKPHITRVYFYSSSNISNNTSESHYSSPSSLPVLSKIPQIKKLAKKNGHSVSVQDISVNRVEKTGLWVAASFPDIEEGNGVKEKNGLTNKNSASKPSVFCSTIQNTTKTYYSLQHMKNKEGDCFFEDNFNKRKPCKITQEKIQNMISSSDIRISESRYQGHEDTRMNSITVLLNEFRKKDSTNYLDKHAMTYPITSSPVTTSSSISMPSSPTLSEYSENSTALSGISKYRPLIQSPVDHWLFELPSLHESECSVMLQSKSLPRKVSPPRCQPIEDIKNIQEQAREVSKCFADLCRIISCQSKQDHLITAIDCLETEVFKLFGSKSYNHRKESIVLNKELLELPGLRLKYLSDHHIRDEEAQEKNKVLVREHQKILNLLHDLKVATTLVRKSHKTQIVEIVTEFGSCLTVLVELILSTKVQVIVSSLKDPCSVTELEKSIGNITSLGLEGNHLCRLVARFGGVRLLVCLLSDNKFSSVRGTVLRSLGTVCCVLEAIRQLEEVRGVEVIASMLGHSETSEMEKAEAAGVLAQVTSPWIEENDYVLGVTENAFYLVKELTEMCRNSKCAETFLLSSAALANLSFLSPLILTAMSQMDTVSVLLSFLSHNVSPSIYIQDQVATVLANMAARQDTRDLLLNCDLVHVLLYLLAASPTNSQLPAMAATQRVQQKAAIAIARLSSSPTVVSGVLSGSGLDRLVELSVCKKARLDSDSTLVAVITAVRRLSLSTNIKHLLADLGATDLLNSSLVTSFKMFSTKYESFV